MPTSPWDSYAEFYDWENARTFGRRDVAFWRGVVRRERGPVLELGCGTGRVLFPIARTGVTIVMPRGGNIWRNPAFAGYHSFNGCGVMTGYPTSAGIGNKRGPIHL